MSIAVTFVQAPPLRQGVGSAQVREGQRSDVGSGETLTSVCSLALRACEGGRGGGREEGGGRQGRREEGGGREDGEEGWRGRMEGKEEEGMRVCIHQSKPSNLHQTP